ncbi:MAG: phosphoenolpyruvate--protein phosphotransferase [Pirellulaceae bacterium]|jgi:phosphoenolpyruvate-protein phosphotransferase (PTS system enzyme I)|nr:phosphoenolpyruvate--protein phosphotransferase [Pirellulaceae bacterium]
MKKGIPVSPGVSIGTAYCISEIFVRPEKTHLEEDAVGEELARFESAKEQTIRDLKALESKVYAQVGPSEAAVFAMHQSILCDNAFTKKVSGWIVDEKLTVQAALHRFLEEYSVLFSKTKDEYLQERFADIRDVVSRLSASLTDVKNEIDRGLEGPLIVVADELLPSQVVLLGDVEVKGIVTQAGGPTSHAAIIARSKGIPAVSGVPGILRQIKTGDTIMVDGREGVIRYNLDPESIAAYRKLEREFFDFKDQLAENRDEPTITADGLELELLANINSTTDAESAVAMGGNGVGLYRTEYLYLTHPNVPDEEEQYENYRRVIQSAPNNQVTIRTLDIGGDKTVPYLGHNHQESNPFMGWRSIRLSFEHPELFNTQIRAILRAAADFEFGKVRMLFPMVTTVDEMRRVRSMVRRAMKQLVSLGKPFANVPIGMMLEVPAAAIMMDTLLEGCDFVSVGSNDLVQYLMAADRDNPKVSHLCQPLSPPVLRVLKNVIRICNQNNTPITVCGEMAGQPKAFVLLLGMGLKKFSMSPAFIPTIKELAKVISRAEAAQILQNALKLKTTSQVQRYMAGQLQRLAPKFTILDTA